MSNNGSLKVIPNDAVGANIYRELLQKLKKSKAMNAVEYLRS